MSACLYLSIFTLKKYGCSWKLQTKHMCVVYLSLFLTADLTLCPNCQWIQIQAFVLHLLKTYCHHPHFGASIYDLNFNVLVILEQKHHDLVLLLTSISFYNKLYTVLTYLAHFICTFFNQYFVTWYDLKFKRVVLPSSPNIKLYWVCCLTHSSFYNTLLMMPCRF